MIQGMRFARLMTMAVRKGDCLRLPWAIWKVGAAPGVRWMFTSWEGEEGSCSSFLWIGMAEEAGVAEGGKVEGRDWEGGGVVREGAVEDGMAVVLAVALAGGRVG